jgi:hypothetical protein
VAVEVQKALSGLPVAKDGKDGASVTVADVEPLVASLVQKAFDTRPTPKDGRDGRDVDMAAVEVIVSAAVQALPPPNDGKDGKDGVTLDEIEPRVKALVDAQRVDPVGVQSALIDQAGDLVLTFTDGRVVPAGRAKGADADPALITKAVAEAIERFPAPKDGAPGVDGKDGAPGKDGVSFDEITSVMDEARGVTVVTAKSGDRSHVWAELPVQIYRGVHKAGDQYRMGHSVTYRGDLWIARKDTFETPGEGKTHWQLAVKRGRDGRDRRGEE